MVVIYEWVDKREHSEIKFRFTHYEDECEDYYHDGEPYTVREIYLEECIGNDKWEFVECFEGWATALNILHLLEKTLGKKIEGSYT